MKNNLRLFLLLLSLSLLVTACREKPVVSSYSGKRIKQMISAAMNGNLAVNDTLGKLFDPNLPVTNNFHQYYFDSLTVQGKQKFFFAVLEFPNPLYNRLVIYDSLLNVYLMDKSLNGNLTVNVSADSLFPLIQITEAFRSKDSIRLQRLNLYYAGRDTVTSVLRTFIQFNEGKKEYKQKMVFPEIHTINATITSADKKEKGFPINNKYVFDSTRWSYITRDSSFEKLVLSLIQRYSFAYSKNQIVDKVTAMKSVGTQQTPDSAKKANNEVSKTGFSLTLPPEGWRTQKDVFITQSMKKPKKGIVYSNVSQGASFSVIEIAENEQAENFVFYTLDKENQGKYKVRYTDNIMIKKNYVRYFELSCLNKKYLVIFDVPLFSYQANKKVYETIINSFTIDC